MYRSAKIIKNIIKIYTYKFIYIYYFKNYYKVVKHSQNKYIVFDITNVNTFSVKTKENVCTSKILLKKNYKC